MLYSSRPPGRCVSPTSDDSIYGAASAKETKRGGEKRSRSIYSPTDKTLREKKNPVDRIRGETRGRHSAERSSET